MINVYSSPIAAFVRHQFVVCMSEFQESVPLHQSSVASTWWCGPQPRLVWVEMAVGLLEGLSYPGHSPHKSFFCRDWKGSTQSFKSVDCYFSSLSRLLILLVMSGYIHLSPGPIFHRALEIWPGGVALCNTAPAPNGSFKVLTILFNSKL